MPLVLGVSCVAFVYIQQEQYSANKCNSQDILLRLFTFVCLHKNGGVILFYLNFVRLCNKIGKSPSAVAEEMGFQRSVVTRWSNGSAPRKATIEKIATFFNVPSEELTGETEQKEKPSTPEGDGLDEQAKSFAEKLMQLDEPTRTLFNSMLDAAIAEKLKKNG
ncbi:MAG: helix-turn-helix domain protein [Bacteriophage sp.]|nr:MAG: helix-turn-helix domain protein [Bacteriophage sp.]